MQDRQFTREGEPGGGDSQVVFRAYPIVPHRGLYMITYPVAVTEFPEGGGSYTHVTTSVGVNQYDFKKPGEEPRQYEDTAVERSYLGMEIDTTQPVSLRSLLDCSYEPLLDACAGMKAGTKVYLHTEELDRENHLPLREVVWSIDQDRTVTRLVLTGVEEGQISPLRYRLSKRDDTQLAVGDRTELLTILPHPTRVLAGIDALGYELPLEIGRVKGVSVQTEIEITGHENGRLPVSIPLPDITHFGFFNPPQPRDGKYL